MKKIFFTVAAGAVMVTSVQSCGALGTTGTILGLQVLQAILRGGSAQGFGILKNPNEFMTNALIEAAMPQELRKVNNTLESIGLTNIVQKEKQYIAEAAKLTAKTAEPIVTSAINEMTAEDALKIMQGGKGAATAYLKEKTAAKLIQAIQPQMESELNKVGLVQTLNTALSGSSAGGILGAIFGKNNQNQVNSASLVGNLAAQQMVNGLFKIIENYEMTNAKSTAAWQSVK